MDSDRPERRSIIDELGRKRTLAQGPDQYGVHAGGSAGPALLLGLGPDPADAPVEGAGGVYYVECPDFLSQCSIAIPEGWTRLDAVEPDLVRGARVVTYRPGLKLFPSFWGPVLAAVQTALLFPQGPPAAQPAVLLPGGDGDLLTAELAAAFQAAGYAPITVKPEETGERLPELLRQGGFQLFFSVNFRGLDPLGERFYLLQQAGVRTAVWLVDNPWHLLSGQQSPYWKQADIFVTDQSFILDLMRMGVSRVRHLPLAVQPELFAAPQESFPELEDRLVFVGRSAFPARKGFFAGLQLPQEQWETARSMLGRGGRPHYHWWTETVGVSWPHGFWPGKEARLAGLGAEESSRLQRAQCLSAGARAWPTTVFGDAAWKELVPELQDLRPPVDYYGSLPGVYCSAGFSLNVTSLLLPAGLTQRHFDVWAAGGFLVTDATEGLSIFPQELADPVRFSAPEDLPAVLAQLESEPALKRDLAVAWRAEILSRHTYSARVAAVLQATGLS